MSWSRILSALGVLVALGAPASPAVAAVGSPMTPTQVAHAVADGVTVDLVQVAPTVVGPGDTQTVTVRITNGTGSGLAGASAELYVGWAPVTSRTELAAWADPESTLVAGTQQELEDVPDVAPGESVEVTIELDVDGLQLGADAVWGPRLMSVDVVSSAGVSQDMLRTFLLFDPAAGDVGEGQAPAVVRLSVVAPVTGPPLDPQDTDAYAAELATRTVAGGSLTRVLDTALGAPGEPTVSLAVDPAVVAAAAGSDEPGAVGWADRLTGDVPTTDAVPPDVVTLPPLDPDLGAIAHAGVDASAATVSPSALPLAPEDWEIPAGWDTTLAWPARTPDLATLQAARQLGADHVLVTEGLVPTTQLATPGLATVETPEGDVSAVVADKQLSDTLLAATGRGDAAATTAETTQRVLADLAVLASDAAFTGTGAHVVAAMPRGWSPDVTATREALLTLEDEAWVDIVPLSSLLDTSVVDVPRTDLEEARRTRGELRAAVVRDLAAARRETAALATMAADPQELAGDVDLALAAPLSIAFRSARPERAAAAEFALAQAAELHDGIAVVPRGELTLVSAALDLPVRIRNDHPTDATVTVVLRPDDPRLKVDEQPTVVVPAGQSLDVSVRVRAIGSGDVEVDVDVLAPSGARAAEPATIAVRVRAGWETVGTAVVAGAVGLLFLFGIWRTVRRGRSPRRTTGEHVAESAPTGPTPRTPRTERKP